VCACFCAFVVLIALTACGVSSHNSTVSTDASPPSSAGTPVRPGQTLPARWWAWVESAPVTHNPVDDSSGVDCARNQPADVWFLAGTHGGSAVRVCSIPVARPIYVPIINQICEVPTGQVPAEAIRSCTVHVDSAIASLDGTPLRPKAATSGGVFTFTAKPHSSTGFSPGPHLAVTSGLWVGPLKLAQGQHTLLLDGRAGSFRTTVRYRLTAAASP
jgi:hypothetical protein